MFAPLQQAGQWVAQKAQSFPVKAHQPDSDTMPETGFPMGYPVQAAYGPFEPSSLPMPEDTFEKQRGFSPQQEAQLLGSLKNRIAHAPWVERLTQKLPLKRAENQMMAHEPTPSLPGQGMMGQVEQKAELSFTERWAQKFRRHRLLPSKQPQKPPSGFLSREAVMKGFPVLYRDLKTVPRFTLTPEEIAINPIADRFHQLEADFFAEPWDSEHLFTPYGR